MAPPHNQRHPCPALVEAALAVPQRGIVRNIAAAAFREPFARVATDPAIVAREDQHRVLRQFQLLQLRHDAPDTLVDTRDHRRVGRIIVPADPRLALKFSDQLRLRLVRRVDAEVRQIEEKRPILFPRDVVHRAIREKVRQILAFRILRLGTSREIEVHPHAHDRLVEPALARRMRALLPDVPLAKHPRRIPRRLQRLRQDHAVERQLRDIVHRSQRPLAPVEPLHPAHRVDARARPILPAHQRRARRRAVLAMVVVRKLHPLRRQPVDVRRLVILAPVGREVRVAEVVGHDENNIRFGRRGSQRDGRGSHADQSETG